MEDPAFKLKEQAQVICTELFNLGEHSMFLSVNASNQTSTILGSSQGMVFLQTRLDIIEQFYKYCSGQQMMAGNKQDAETMTGDLEQVPSDGGKLTDQNTSTSGDVNTNSEFCMNGKVINIKNQENTKETVTPSKLENSEIMDANTKMNLITAENNDDSECENESFDNMEIVKMGENSDNMEIVKMGDNSDSIDIVKMGDNSDSMEIVKMGDNSKKSTNKDLCSDQFELKRIHDIPLVEQNLNMGDIFETEEDEEHMTSSRIGYSGDKKNASKTKMKAKTINKKSIVWKDRLTRQRKPTALAIEAQKVKENKAARKNNKKHVKVTNKAQKKIINVKLSADMENRNIKTENSRKDEENEIKENRKNKSKKSQKKKIKITKYSDKEIKDMSFDIYNCGKQVLRNVYEVPGEDINIKQKLPGIKVQQMGEAEYFVDFVNFGKEGEILKEKKKRVILQHDISPNVPNTFERTSDGRYICDFCGKTQTTKSLVTRHRRTHTNERPYKCDECGKTFRQYGHLRKHRISHNPEHRPHMCDTCGKTFSYLESLKAHKRTHMDLPQCECPECGQVFARIELLKAHMNSKKQSFMCEICGKSFRWKECLQIHLPTHDENRTKEFQCDQCDKKFYRKSRLKYHIKRVHCKILKYKCDCCDIWFSERHRMVRHMLRKSGNAPHQNISEKSNKKGQLTNKNNKLTNKTDESVQTNLDESQVATEQIIPISSTRLDGDHSVTTTELLDQSPMSYVYQAINGTSTNEEKIIYVINTPVITDVRSIDATEN